jgi:hypothetical protein
VPDVPTPDGPVRDTPAPAPRARAAAGLDPCAAHGVGPALSRRAAVRAAGAALLAAAGTATGGVAACGRDRPAGGATARDAGEPPRPAPPPGRLLDVDDEALAEAVADTLLPTTAASPGARAAGAGAAMNLLVSDCYAPDAQQRFLRGLAEVRAAAAGRGGAFAALAPAAREALLRDLDAATRRAGDGSGFAVVREVAERAYFTSEVGMTRALRYVRVPGRWTGCVPLAPGQPAWG